MPQLFFLSPASRAVFPKLVNISALSVYLYFSVCLSLSVSASIFFLSLLVSPKNHQFLFTVETSKLPAGSQVNPSSKPCFEMLDTRWMLKGKYLQMNLRPRNEMKRNQKRMEKTFFDSHFGCFFGCKCSLHRNRPPLLCFLWWAEFRRLNF